MNQMITLGYPSQRLVRVRDKSLFSTFVILGSLLCFQLLLFYGVFIVFNFSYSWYPSLFSTFIILGSLHCFQLMLILYHHYKIYLYHNRIWEHKFKTFWLFLIFKWTSFIGIYCQLNISLRQNLTNFIWTRHVIFII